MGISRARVMQIEQAALRKLRRAIVDLLNDDPTASPSALLDSDPPRPAPACRCELGPDRRAYHPDCPIHAAAAERT